MIPIRINYSGILIMLPLAKRFLLIKRFPTKRLLLQSCKNNPCCQQLSKAIPKDKDKDKDTNKDNDKVLNNGNICYLSGLWYLSGLAMLPIAFCFNYKAALIAIPCMFIGDIYTEAYNRKQNEYKHT